MDDPLNRVVLCPKDEEWIIEGRSPLWFGRFGWETMNFWWSDPIGSRIYICIQSEGHTNTKSSKEMQIAFQE